MAVLVSLAHRSETQIMSRGFAVVARAAITTAMRMGKTVASGSVKNLTLGSVAIVHQLLAGMVTTAQGM
tara:strand:- start:1361 stop:1567 length:207 start_codon:yes stop_codon:yes gene_type:complete